MRGARHLRSYLLLGAALACIVAPCRAPTAQASSKIRPGTHTLRLSRVTCDPRYPKNTFRSGWIVLDAAPLNLANLPDSIRRVFELIPQGIYLGPANGCFHFTSNRPEVQTYAGIAGVLHWDRRSTDDSVMFQLYESDDAAHNVQVAATPGGFAGTRHSWGAGMASVGYPDDLGVGEYVGPPNVARCEEAGNAYLAEMCVVVARTRAMLPTPPCDSALAAQVASAA